MTSAIFANNLTGFSKASIVLVFLLTVQFGMALNYYIFIYKPGMLFPTSKISGQPRTAVSVALVKGALKENAAPTKKNESGTIDEKQQCPITSPLLSKCPQILLA